jgi:hypothetical protein
MKNLERIRERFLRDDLPTRLGGLAADLSRVASSARRSTGGSATLIMLEESQYFIEWTAAEVAQAMAAEVAEELVNLQILLALWRRVWPEVELSQRQRMLLSVQAKQWSERVMDLSVAIAKGTEA